MSSATLLNQTAFLLDVNVLLALFDPMHVHHNIVRRWYVSGPHIIATCPLSELGFVRICSNPRYPNALDSPEDGLSLLRALHSDPRHVFWPDDVSLADNAFSVHPFRTHRDTTDRYLLHLAATRGGQLLTLDAGIKSANAAERAALCLVVA
jgi:uncharacterized protein